MDEKQLSELFQDAVRDTPPATFGTGEIRRASQRATTRLRNGVVAGSALALVLLGGGVIGAVALSGGELASTASSPGFGGGTQDSNSGSMGGEGNAQAPRQAEPGPAPLNVPPGSPKQGGTPGGEAGGSAGSTLSGCGQADRGLAAALAGELPAAARKIVTPVPFDCPAGSRAAAYKVTDGPKSGTITVVLVPRGAEAASTPMGTTVPGTANYNAPAVRSGGTIVVVSQPTPELAEPPFGDMGDRIAAAIGEQF